MDSLEIKFKISESVSSERVLSHIRSGCLCEGGFIVNSKNEVVLDYQSNQTYKYILFERVGEVKAGVSRVVNDGESPVTENIKSSHPNAKHSTSSTDSSSTNKVTSLSTEQVNGDNKRKEKMKRVVDPDAPKKSLSAYMMYCQDQQQLLRSKNSSMSGVEILSTIGASWSTLKESERAKYNAKADAEKNRYEIEKQGTHIILKITNSCLYV